MAEVVKILVPIAVHKNRELKSAEVQKKGVLAGIVKMILWTIQGGIGRRELAEEKFWWRL